MLEGNAGVNRKALARLERSINAGYISHAYLFAGLTYDERLRLAKDVIRLILCDAGGCGTCPVCRKIESGNHVDVMYVEGRSGKKLVTEDVEDMQRFLRRRPYEAERNIAVITKADNIDRTAEKKLLKTLEEPETGTVMILLADNLSGIDETIRSRCVIYRLREKQEYSAEAAGYAGRMVEAITEDRSFAEKKDLVGEIANAHKKAEDTNLAAEILECLEDAFMDRISDGRSDCLDSVHRIEEAKKMLRVNVKTAAVFMYLLLEAEEDKW